MFCSNYSREHGNPYVYLARTCQALKSATQEHPSEIPLQVVLQDIGGFSGEHVAHGRSSKASSGLVKVTPKCLGTPLCHLHS